MCGSIDINLRSQGNEHYEWILIRLLRKSGHSWYAAVLVIVPAAPHVLNFLLLLLTWMTIAIPNVLIAYTMDGAKKGECGG